ncbi:MAG: PilZ domain-containing protein [Lachnospiraceae bacterium]|nr:PilZ domain-containing protein [Lachnospiraceae bacterium]
MEERRKSQRRELKSSLLIKRLDKSEPDEVLIDIVDVSKTGVGFKTRERLEIGSIYESFLTIWTKEQLHTFLEIIRIEKNDDGTYNYGAYFVGMPEMQGARIEIYNLFENAEENK